MRNLFTLVILCLIQLHAIGQNELDTIRQNNFDSSILSIDSIPKQAAIFKKQSEIYRLKPGVDIPLTAIGLGWSLYAFSEIYSKERSSEEDILSLNVQDIPAFDRHGASVYHPDADIAANILFYGAMPLPLLLLFDKDIRKDAFKIAFLYLEAMSVTGLLYTGSVYLADRYRPYAYNPDAPMEERTRGGAKNSFYAGHVALVGTSTFFIAKVLTDYHPDWKAKWLPFTLASVATGATAYLRYRGGQHFLSDILLGLTQGTLSGILVPHFHKNKPVDGRISFTASYFGKTPQFGFTYKLIK